MTNNNQKITRTYGFPCSEMLITSAKLLLLIGAILVISWDIASAKDYERKPQVSSSANEVEIREFIQAWGEAWSPKDNAQNFTRESFTPFYVQGDELLAFDFSDAEKRTVIKGAKDHADMWEPFVKSFKYWTFTPDINSLRIYTYSDKAAAATLFVDNFGIMPDGKEFKANAHATLLLEKRDGKWLIIHENIWGPVNE